MTAEPGGLWIILLVLGAFAVLLTGCVSMGTYESLKREADQAKQLLRETQSLYAREKLWALSLEQQNTKLKAQADMWEANFRATIQRLEELAEEWDTTPEDLLGPHGAATLRRTHDGAPRRADSHRRRTLLEGAAPPSPRMLPWTGAAPSSDP